MEASDGVQPGSGADAGAAVPVPVPAPVRVSAPRPLEYAATDLYVSGHALAMWVIGFLIGLLFVELVDVLGDLNELSLFRRAVAGQVIPNSEIDFNDAAQQLLMMGQQLAMLGLAVVVPLWLWRVYRNLPVLGARDLSFGRAWALAGWFVPILCFFVPFQIVRETWQCSALGEDVGDRRSRKEVPTTPLLGVWWVAWWLSMSMTASSVAMLARAKMTNRLQDGLTSSWFDLFASVLSIIAALSLLYIVRAIDRRQDEKSWFVLNSSSAMKH